VSRFSEIQDLIGSRYLVQDRLVSNFGERFLATDAKGFPFIVRLFEHVDEEATERLLKAFIPFIHPSVCAFVDSGSGPHHVWLARPFLDGPDLENVLEKGPFPPEQVLQLVLDLLDGLDAMHSESLIYNNWTRANLICHQDRWVMCELGLWESQDAHRRMNFVPAIQNLPYLAPEQIVDSRSTSAQSDLYSLGVVAFHCLKGEQLFYTENFMSYIESVLTEEARVRARCPNAPEELAVALEILLSKEPESRDLQKVRDLLLREPVVSPSPEPNSRVQGLLSEMREAGRGKGSGRFTLDPVRALAKLRDFQFERPHHFLFPLIAGLIARGASRLDISSKKRRLTLKSDAVPLDASELENLLLTACTAERRDPLARLGLGLASSFGAGASCVKISTGSYRATMNGVQEVAMKKNRGSGIVVEIESNVVGVDPPPDLFTRFLYSPIDINWNGRPLCASSRPPELAKYALDGEEFAIEGAPQAIQPGLFVRVDGLTYQLSGFFEWSEAVVILSGPWKLSLSYQAIRGDKRRKELALLARELLLKEVALNARIDLGKGSIYETVLNGVEDPEVRDVLHQRIVSVAEVPPLDDPEREFSRSPNQSSYFNALVANSCEVIFQQKLPLIGAASRLLTTPDYFQEYREWAEIEELAKLAFEDESEAQLRFLLRAFLLFPQESLPLERATSLLQHLELVPWQSRYGWDQNLGESLQAVVKRDNQAFRCCREEWLKLLPEGFEGTQRLLSSGLI
jgi:hypothetical protein